MENTNLVLQNQRLNEEIKRRTDQISAINIIATAVGHSMDLNLTLNTALDAIRSAVGAEAAGISLIDESSNELILRAQAGWINDFVITNPMRIPLGQGEGMSDWVITHDQVLVHNNLDGSETYAVPSFKKEAFKALAMAPMHGRGRIIGILSIMSHTPDYFDDETIGVLKSIADTVGTAIENARLYEQQLEQENRLKAVLHSTADGIIATDQNGRISLVNYAAASLLSVRASDLQGLPLREAPIYIKVRDGLLKVLDAPDDTTLRTFQVSVEDGPELSVMVSPVRVPSQITAQVESDGWVIVLQDITHLREAEIARVQFIQAAAHDMKNPLGVTQSSLHMLESMIQTDDKTVQEVMAIARTSIKRLRRLIDDMMHIEEIESGYNLHIEEIDLREMCFEIGVQTGPLLSSAGIKLETVLADDLPTTLSLDREWIQRALNNYLENAAKYAPNTQVQFKVYRKENYVHFEVIDDGPGIPRQAQTRLFERFFRVSARHVDVDGSGLGLAIVKSVAEAHRGTAYVHSEEGQGSTFGITIMTGLSAGAKRNV